MTTDISERIKIGLDHHQRGRLQQAEAIYQSILTEQPDHADALNLLGVLSLQVGKNERAVDLIEKAIEIKPGEPEFHNMCGEAYRALREYDEAIIRYERAIAIKPDNAGAHNNLGNTFKEIGSLDDAVSHYQAAIAISPDFAMSHNNLGVVLKDLGQTDSAVEHFRRALTIIPDYAEAHSNLGNALQSLGRHEECISHYEQALALTPDYAPAYSNLANALRQMGRIESAIANYQQAILLQPGFAMAHYNLGIAYDEHGRPSDAVSSYRRALAIEPDYAEAHHNLGNALSELGQRDDAVLHYQQAVALKPAYAEAHRNLARIAPDPTQIPVVSQLIRQPSLSETDAIHIHFALGNLYNNVGRFDKAFEHFNIGNSLKRKTIDFQSQMFSEHVDKLIAVYSQSLFDKDQPAGSGSDLPVFIVGMPRSGTSLVEQIVASHPDIFGAGELASIGQIERDIAERLAGLATYPECMNLCDPTIARHFSDKYIDELRSYSSTAKRISDKMPDNFMRLGLIKTLFPKARIIHCQRNALDTCVSNYLNYFETGNTYSFDLIELGNYYLDYMRLMKHWATLFSTDILNVNYENLVANQEKVSRELIRFLDLSWNDRCLDFHANSRSVNTFSSLQVRQPIYSHAVSRWKNYERHLGPLLSILADV